MFMLTCVLLVQLRADIEKPVSLILSPIFLFYLIDSFLDMLKLIVVHATLMHKYKLFQNGAILLIKMLFIFKEDETALSDKF